MVHVANICKGSSLKFFIVKSSTQNPKKPIPIFTSKASAYQHLTAWAAANDESQSAKLEHITFDGTHQEQMLCAWCGYPKPRKVLHKMYGKIRKPRTCSECGGWHSRHESCDAYLENWERRRKELQERGKRQFEKFKAERSRHDTDRPEILCPIRTSGCM